MECDEQGSLKLNHQSREVLFNKRRVVMKRGRKKQKDAGREDLFRALERLRYEISAREYVAASALFSDGTLWDLCRILPRTKKQLTAVDGMGVYKTSRYGEQILAVIRRYAPEPESAPAARRGAFQEYKANVIAKGSTEAYQSWSKEEDRQLAREHEEGKTPKEMAEIHKRTRGAIRSRLKKLELI
jgi:ATP-dependent DNA helicase RecQ